VMTQRWTRCDLDVGVPIGRVDIKSGRLVAIGLDDQDDSRARNIGEVKSAIAFHELTLFVPEDATKSDPDAGRQTIPISGGYYLAQNSNVGQSISLGDGSLVYALLTSCAYIHGSVSQSCHRNRKHWALWSHGKA